MPQLSDREYYASDNRLSLAGIPLLLTAPVLIGLLGGWLLSLLYAWNFYIVVMVPALVALGMGGLFHLLVGWARCRNPLFAGFMGLVAGGLAYVSYFYFCMQREAFGFPVPIDFLPDYFLHRMQNGIIEDVGRPGGGGGRPVAFFNWLFAVLDLGFLTVIPYQFASRRARRAFSTDQNCWYQAEEVKRMPHQGHLFVEALENGEIAKALRDAPANGHPQQASRFILEWLDQPDSSPLDFPVYASIEDHYDTPLLRTMKRMVHRQFELTPQEALSLRPLFPKLAVRLDVAHPELQAVPAQLFTTTPSKQATEFATVTPVKEPFRQRVRTRGYALKVNLIDMTPLLYMFGGMSVLALGGWLVSIQQIVLSAIPFAVGGVSLAWGCYAGTVCQSVSANRWINRRLRSEVSRRPTSLVELDDPDTRYVSIIPREAFSKIQLTMSSDLLLMALDDKKREIRLEGDLDRYVIPAGAINDCQPLCFFHPLDGHHATQIWMVRLLIQREGGEQEVMLAVNKLDWKWFANKRREESARDVCERVKEWMT